MFRHILVPTDGSRFATRAAEAAIRLAQSTGARVTAYCSVPSLRQDFYGDGAARDRLLVRLKRQATAKAIRHIAAIERMASRSGVAFDSRVDAAEPTYAGIIGAARKARCDLIFMGSQGRSGLRAVLLGSVASQVVNHSGIPVLVYRRPLSSSREAALG